MENSTFDTHAQKFEMTNFDLTYQKALPPFVFQNEKNMCHYDANLVEEEAVWNIIETSQKENPG